MWLLLDQQQVIDISIYEEFNGTGDTYYMYTFVGNPGRKSYMVSPMGPLDLTSSGPERSNSMSLWF